MDKKRKELLAFIKKHPKASQHTVIKSGFAYVLKSQFGNSINKARTAAEVPIIIYNAERYKRKLSIEDENIIICLYNSKISIAKLAKEFKVNQGTIVSSLFRARENGKQVLGDPKKRTNFAIKTYNSYRKGMDLNKEHQGAKELLEDHVIFPLIRKNISSALKDIKIRPYVGLLTKLSGFEAKKDKFYDDSKMLSKLEGIIKKEYPRFNFNKNTEKTINRTMNKPVRKTFVKNGQYCAFPFTGTQKENLNGIFEGILKPREKQVIYLRYGFEDGYCRSLDKVGEILNIGKERTRQIEKRSLAKLQYSVNYPLLMDYLKIGRVKVIKAQIKNICRIKLLSGSKQGQRNR